MIARDYTSRPLWTCPKCGKAFVNRNSWHSCSVVPLSAHFDGRPRARKLFYALRAAIREFGPVKIVSNKTRIAFMVRVRFAGCAVRKDWLRCGVWLKRRADAPRVVRIEEYTPEDFGHYFEIRELNDIDEEVRALLREAYDIGCQRHLTPARRVRGRRQRSDG